MKLNNMKMRYWIIPGLLLLAVISGCRQVSEPEPEKPDLLETPSQVILHTPEEVVAVFCENFFDSAPPNHDQMAARLAYKLLSNSTQSDLSGIRAGLSSRLSLFAGVQDAPDLGFQIMRIIDKTDEWAWVETRWDYSGENNELNSEVRVFALAKQGGEWKINDIQ